MGEISFDLQIPADDDGYIPMECPLCGERFGLKPDDLEDDAVLEIACPHCGIVSDNYFTQEVIDLAMAKAANIAMGQLYNEMAKLEKKTKGGAIEIKASKKSQGEPEPMLTPDVNALVQVQCESCGRAAKVTPLLALSVFVCPCCGVSNFHG